MLAILGSTDITKLIDRDSYDINSEDLYDEWQNGNDTFIRNYSRSRISGSFTVLCWPGKTMSDSAFLTLLGDNTTTAKITTITLYVNNKATMEAINCYVKITTDSLKYVGEDRVVVYKLEIEER